MDRYRKGSIMVPFRENVMTTLVLKNFPEELHAKLKVSAEKNHRSMTKEAIALLQSSLESSGGNRELPPLVKGKFPLTQKMLNEAKREGRS